MKVYAIRGAITVAVNEVDAILTATTEMMKEIISKNQLSESDYISFFFTTTHDLNAVFPARAIREMGLTNTSLMCAQEINVPGALPRCIRVMIHVHKENDFKPKHIYLRDARRLRPDLTQAEELQ